MNTKQAVGFLGIGIFLYIILTSLEFNFSKILQDILIWTEWNTFVIHALAIYISLALIILLFIFSKEWIKNKWFNGLEIKGTFKILIVVYLLIMIFQMSLPFFQGLYQNDHYFDIFQAYRNTLDNKYMLSQLLVDTPSFVIKCLAIGIIIGELWVLRNIFIVEKTKKTEKSNQENVIVRKTG